MNILNSKAACTLTLNEKIKENTQLVKYRIYGQL